MPTVPQVTFHTRVRDESIGGDNPFRWQDVTTEELFAGKTALVFSLPGAFTPTCSTMQLPTFEAMAPKFYEVGVDVIYCVSVNDTFVMNAWAKSQELQEVKVIPDGSAHFTREMGYLVDKDNLGFGQRSWRYAMLVEDQEIITVWVEPGLRNDADDDPYGETDPTNIFEDIQKSLQP
jgi:peroxiredoxin